MSCICHKWLLLGLIVALQYAHGVIGLPVQAEFNRKLSLDALQHRARSLKQDAALFARCGGLAPNDLPDGKTAVDDCFSTCPSGATCFRQNEYYWQCLKEDPCNNDGWDCSKTCSDATTTPPTEVVQLTGFLGEFEKCGNELPFFGADLCKTGLRCTRKDKYFMQCMAKVEDSFYQELAAGDQCGTDLPYDTESVKVCPANTACLTQDASLKGPWVCASLSNGGYFAKASSSGDDTQCYSLLDGFTACSISKFCFQYDKYYGGCIAPAAWTSLNDKDECGDSNGPYSGGAAGYGNKFCPIDKPCVPEADYWDSADGVTPGKWVCSGETVQLAENVQCGDASGPWNGYFTCSSATADNLRLCLQNPDEDKVWRCKNVAGLKGLQDGEVCGNGAPYSDPKTICDSAKSSCYLKDYATGEFQCAGKDDARCPEDWDCKYIKPLPGTTDATSTYCGPFSESQAAVDALKEAFNWQLGACDAGQYCLLKDPLGTFQCVAL
jgi:hypothetical protein